VGCLLNISRLRLKIRVLRVEEHADQSCCWNEIVQEPEPRPPACGPAGYLNGMRLDQNSAGR
jgi:hypothetical protein